MSGRRSKSVRSVIIAVAVIAVGSVAISTYAGAQFLEADRETTKATSIGLPSANRVTDARAALRGIDATMDGLMLALIRGEPFDRHTWDQGRGVLQVALARYERLPDYPDARARYEHVLAGVRTLDVTATTLLEIFARGDLARAEEVENKDWRIASDALDGALYTLNVYYLEHVEIHAMRLATIARTAVFTIALAGLVNLALAILGAILVIRVLREHERVLEERAAEWEMFSSRVAHDLVNPLQTITLSIQLAEEAADPTIRKAMARAVTASARMRSTMDALLAFAKSGGRPTESERAAVPEVISTIVEELRPIAAAQKVELASAPAPAVEVGCSSSVLHILLSNLIGNAIKYMGDRPVRRIEVKVAAAGATVRLEIHDTGPGLEPGAEQEILEPYVRGKVGKVAGIGLGLATVKRLAEAHGGSVGVRSVTGEGSVFWVELPAVHA